MDDLEVMGFQLLIVMGAFFLGVWLGWRDGRRLPPPDSSALRGKVSHL